ncbi:hypothetical protein ACFL5U_03970, partial [Candidatus Margulisiibacteriota bacterium]
VWAYARDRVGLYDATVYTPVDIIRDTIGPDLSNFEIKNYDYNHDTSSPAEISNQYVNSLDAIYQAEGNKHTQAVWYSLERSETGRVSDAKRLWDPDHPLPTADDFTNLLELFQIDPEDPANSTLPSLSMFSARDESDIGVVSLNIQEMDLAGNPSDVEQDTIIYDNAPFEYESASLGASDNARLIDRNIYTETSGNDLVLNTTWGLTEREKLAAIEPLSPFKEAKYFLRRGEDLFWNGSEWVPDDSASLFTISPDTPGAVIESGTGVDTQWSFDTLALPRTDDYDQYELVIKTYDEAGNQGQEVFNIIRDSDGPSVVFSAEQEDRADGHYANISWEISDAGAGLPDPISATVNWEYPDGTTGVPVTINTATGVDNESILLDDTNQGTYVFELSVADALGNLTDPSTDPDNTIAAIDYDIDPPVINSFKLIDPDLDAPDNALYTDSPTVNIDRNVYDLSPTQYKVWQAGETEPSSYDSPVSHPLTIDPAAPNGPELITVFIRVKDENGYETPAPELDGYPATTTFDRQGPVLYSEPPVGPVSADLAGTDDAVINNFAISTNSGPNNITLRSIWRLNDTEIARVGNGLAPPTPLKEAKIYLRRSITGGYLIWDKDANDDGVTDDPDWVYSSGNSPAENDSDKWFPTTMNTTAGTDPNGADTTWTFTSAPELPRDFTYDDTLYSPISGYDKKYDLVVHVSDAAGNYTAQDAFRVHQAIAPPPNVDAVTLYDAPVPGSSEISPRAHNWYNQTEPFFTWDEPSHPLGIAGYYVFWGTAVDPLAIDPETQGIFSPHIVYQDDYRTYPLLAGETYYLIIKTQDTAGNISSANTVFTYKFDDSAPTNTTVTINGGEDTYTNTRAVDVALTADDGDPSSGLVFYQYKWETEANFSIEQIWTETPAIPDMPAAETEHTLTIRFIDNAGNHSDAAASITLDQTGPQIDEAQTQILTASPTNATPVEVRIVAAATGAEIAAYMITGDIDPEDTTWTDLETPAATLDIPETRNLATTGFAQKDIYVHVKDTLGNPTVTALPLSITLDQAPPIIDIGAFDTHIITPDPTDQTLIEVKIDASDAISNITKIKFTGDLDPAESTDWRDLDPAEVGQDIDVHYSLTLLTGDDNKNINISLQDEAGNDNDDAVVTLSIELDQIPLVFSQDDITYPTLTQNSDFSITVSTTGLDGTGATIEIPTSIIVTDLNDAAAPAVPLAFDDVDTWTGTIPISQTNAANNYRVTASDALDNQTFVDLPVQHDTQPPEIDIGAFDTHIITADPTDQTTINIMVRASDSISNITEIKFTGDLDPTENTDWRPLEPAEIDHIINLQRPLTLAAGDGPKDINVSIKDAAGNIAEALAANYADYLSIELDEVPLVLLQSDITYPALTQNTDFSISVITTGLDGTGATIEIPTSIIVTDLNDAAAPAVPLAFDDVDTWTGTIPISQTNAPNNYQVIANDALGNQTSVDLPVQHDAQPPDIDIGAFATHIITADPTNQTLIDIKVEASDSISNITKIKFTGDLDPAEDTDWRDLEPAEVAQTIDVQYSLTLSTGDANKNINVYVQDEAGNDTDVPLSIELDEVPLVLSQDDITYPTLT